MSENEKPIPSLPGESARWYSRFLEYVQMDPKKRSFLAVYNAERATARRGAGKTVPESWRRAIEAFRWKARAESFDATGFNQKIKDFEKLRDSEARQRFHTFRALRKKISSELKALLTQPMTWRDCLRGLEILRSLDGNQTATVDGGTDPDEFMRECQRAAEKMMTFEPLGTLPEKH